MEARASRVAVQIEVSALISFSLSLRVAGTFEPHVACRGPLEENQPATCCRLWETWKKMQRMRQACNDGGSGIIALSAQCSLRPPRLRELMDTATRNADLRIQPLTPALAAALPDVDLSAGIDQRVFDAVYQ